MAAGFDADGRAAKRTEGPVRIGGITYHARKLTNGRLRDVRRISREHVREAREAAQESAEYKEAYDEAKSGGASDEEARRAAVAAGETSEEWDRINNVSVAKQLAILLADDNAQPIAEEVALRHLDEDLDQRDIGDLMTYLVGSPDEDPTPAT